MTATILNIIIDVIKKATPNIEEKVFAIIFDTNKRIVIKKPNKMKIAN